MKRLKRPAITACALLAIASLAACSAPNRNPTSEEQVVSSPDADVPVTAEPTATPEPVVENFDYVVDEYKTTFTDEDGFSQTVTFTVGPVMAGTDPNIDRAWRTVGGESDSIPCVASGSSASQNPSLAGFAFGTLAVTNDVPDFAPLAWQYFFAGLGTNASMGFDFSSGGQCSELRGMVPFVPGWESSPNWGPVPVTFALEGFITPAQPTGDPATLEQPLEFTRGGADGGTNRIEVQLQPFVG